MPRHVYQMKATIVITKPPVWRRLLVPKTATLFASPAAAGGVRLVELPNAARRTTGKSDAILKTVIATYRTSNDFDDLHFRPTKTTAERAEAATLIRDGLVEVVSRSRNQQARVVPAD